MCGANIYNGFMLLDATVLYMCSDLVGYVLLLLLLEINLILI